MLGGEQVEIALGADDFWYLSGKSQRSGTVGEAGCPAVREQDAVKPPLVPEGNSH